MGNETTRQKIWIHAATNESHRKEIDRIFRHTTTVKKAVQAGKPGPGKKAVQAGSGQESRPSRQAVKDTRPTR